MAHWIWKLVALLALLGAGLATVVPVLPAVPFLLLASVAAARGWPRLNRWLVAQPLVGPVLVDYLERGVLPLSVKQVGIGSLALSGLLAWIWSEPLWLPLSLDALLLMAGVWLWRRPSA